MNKRTLFFAALVSASTVNALWAASNQQFQITPPPLPMMRMSSDRAELSNDVMYIKAKAGDFKMKGGGYSGLFNVITDDHSGLSINLAMLSMGGDLPASMTTQPGEKGDMATTVFTNGFNLVIDPMGTPGRNQEGWTMPISIGPNYTFMTFEMYDSYLKTSGNDVSVEHDHTLMTGLLYGWQMGAGLGIPLGTNNWMRIFPFYTLNQNLGGSFSFTTDGFSTSVPVEKSPPSTSMGFDIQIPRWGLSVGSVIQNVKKQQSGDKDVKVDIYRFSWTWRFPKPAEQAVVSAEPETPVAAPVAEKTRLGTKQPAPSPAAQPTPSQKLDSKEKELELERQKLELERQKLQLEREKLEFEKEKNKSR
ncbi:MAG TPA: hypothetical protein PK876_02130 [Elusimicrobiota bacterium]|nr:hypothetical protein [Elusimicrobiota bacterium]